MNNQIEKVIARQVWDSRGRPTVEAEITLVGGAALAGGGTLCEFASGGSGRPHRWTMTCAPMPRAREDTPLPHQP